jgi:hypothetical protein
MFSGRTSPYISNSDRLADVIAAIQVMGEYGFHMSRFEKWAERISGDCSKGRHWKRVFEEHPEFFRLDTTRQMASLVWRRQKIKNYDPDLGRSLSKEELDALEPGRVLSRPPLDASDIRALIEAAIALHASEVELQRNRRWWIPLAASGVGALLGALAGSYFRPVESPSINEGIGLARAVQKEGGNRASSVHERKTDAQEQARDQGRKDRVEVVIHGQDGRIQSSNSYGNDPNPPKDNKP